MYRGYSTIPGITVSGTQTSSAPAWALTADNSAEAMRLKRGWLDFIIAVEGGAKRAWVWIT